MNSMLCDVRKSGISCIAGSCSSSPSISRASRRHPQILRDPRARLGVPTVGLARCVAVEPLIGAPGVGADGPDLQHEPLATLAGMPEPRTPDPSIGVGPDLIDV